MVSSKREYGFALGAGAVGAGLVLLGVRQDWARAVFTPPKPLAATVVSVSGADLVPVAEALGIAALACLAAVIATRGAVRRAAGVLLAAFGVGTGIAVSVSVSAASVVSAAVSSSGSSEAAVVSGAAGAAGSTTSGSGDGSGTGLTIVSSAGHAVMAGAQWQAAVLAGAVLIVAAGLATAWRGPRWPVMSARYDPPERRHGTAGTGVQAADRAGDSATMWESLSGGEDPTDTNADGGAARGMGAGASMPGNSPTESPTERGVVTGAGGDGGRAAPHVEPPGGT